MEEGNNIMVMPHEKAFIKILKVGRKFIYTEIITDFTYQVGESENYIIGKAQNAKDYHVSHKDEHNFDNFFAPDKDAVEKKLDETVKWSRKKGKLMSTAFHRLSGKCLLGDFIDEFGKPDNLIEDNWKEIFEDYLPEHAKEKFEMYIDDGDMAYIEIERDSVVSGVFALKIIRINSNKHGYYADEFYMLWSHNDFEECEFETWPPESGELRWF